MDKDTFPMFGGLEKRDLYILTMNAYGVIISFILILLTHEPTLLKFILFIVVSHFVAKTPKIFMESEVSKTFVGMPSGYLGFLTAVILLSLSCGTYVAVYSLIQGHIYAWPMVILPVYNLFSLLYMLWLHRAKRLVIDGSIKS